MGNVGNQHNFPWTTLLCFRCRRHSSGYDVYTTDLPCVTSILPQQSVNSKKWVWSWGSKSLLWWPHSSNDHVGVSCGRCARPERTRIWLVYLGHVILVIGGIGHIRPGPRARRSEFNFWKPLQNGSRAQVLAWAPVMKIVVRMESGRGCVRLWVGQRQCNLQREVYSTKGRGWKHNFTTHKLYIIR